MMPLSWWVSSFGSQKQANICICAFGEIANFQRKNFTLESSRRRQSFLLLLLNLSPAPFHALPVEFWDLALVAAFSSITLNVLHYFSVLPLLSTH